MTHKDRWFLQKDDIKFHNFLLTEPACMLDEGSVQNDDRFETKAMQGLLLQNLFSITLVTHVGQQEWP